MMKNLRKFVNATKIHFQNLIISGDWNEQNVSLAFLVRILYILI